VAKALGTLDPVLKQFDVNNGIMDESGHHSSARSDKDTNMVIGELQSKSIFSKSSWQMSP